MVKSKRHIKGKNMSIKAVSWAFKQKSIPAEAKLLLMVFANFCDHEGFFNYTRDDSWKEDACLSDKDIKRFSNILIRHGMIEDDGECYFLMYPREFYKSDEEIARLRRVKADKHTSRKTVRVAIFERDNYTCQSCGATDNLTIDHIIPVSKGGGNENENLQTLCGSCNSKKGNKI